jgi:threonine dehydratase
MSDMELSDFRRTHERILPYIRRTPVVETDWPGLFLKLENLQHTHSFKIRGAFSRMLKLVEENDRRTVLTVSAGNHGQAVARAASVLGLSCTVVVPETAPRAKVEAIERYGIDLKVEGENYDEAEKLALRLAGDRERYVFVSPYNDPFVILGQGTLALEMVAQQPDLQTVLVPIGGGGLAAGIARAMKQLRPSVRIVGVQAEASAAIYHSLKAGRQITIPDRPSLADGIQGNVEDGSITFELIRDFVDEVVTVTEDAIRESLLDLLHQEKILAEGAAAVTVAAFRAGLGSMTEPTVAVISGGNLDLDKVLG